MRESLRPRSSKLSNAPARVDQIRCAQAPCLHHQIIDPNPKQRRIHTHSQPKIEITLDRTTPYVHVVFMSHAPTAPVVQSAPPPREISPMAAPAKPSRSAALLQIVRTLIEIGRQRLAVLRSQPGP